MNDASISLLPLLLVAICLGFRSAAAMTSTPQLPSNLASEGSLHNMQIAPTLASKPGSVPGFYNPKRRVGRDFVVLSVAHWLTTEARRLSEKSSEEEPSNRVIRPARLLDATCATGIGGLRAALEAPILARASMSQVTNNPHKPELPELQVVLNDMDEYAANLASQNMESLKIREKQADLHLTIAKRNAQALMHEETFEISVLDPFGSVQPFLDSALARAPNRGLIEVCATDVNVLYGTRPSIAKRHYHANLAHRRPPCYRERGVRLLVAAIAQAAGRYDRGVVPIYSLSTEHFCLVSVKVVRGAKAADSTASKVKHVKICRECGAVGDNTKTGVCPPKCGCEPVNGAGTDAQQEGPIWTGPLHDKDSLQGMANIARTKEAEDIISKETRTLLAKLQEEEKVDSMFHRRPGVAAKGMIPKLDAVSEELQRNGYKTARTHFCVKSLKSEASAEEFDNAVKSILAREQKG